MNVSAPIIPVVTISEWDLFVTRTYQSNRNGLIAAASRIVGRDHAADVAQEVFIRVWSHPDAFDPARGTLTHYMYLVIRGMSIDRVRTSASRETRDANDTLRTVPANDEPTSGMIVRQQQVRVRQALAALSEGQREVIIAAYFGHMTYRKVADHLGLPEGTVKSRIRLGLVKLRAELVTAEALAA